MKYYSYLHTLQSIYTIGIQSYGKVTCYNQPDEMPPEMLCLVSSMPQKSRKLKLNFDHKSVNSSQVSGDSASLYPEAPAPAAGTGVVRMEAR